MITTVLLIIIFLIIWKYLTDLIKAIRTGDPNENASNYWKFSYDFKSLKRQDFTPDNSEFLKKKEIEIG